MELDCVNPRLRETQAYVYFCTLSVAPCCLPPDQPKTGYSLLSDREREILLLLAEANR